MTCSKQIVKCYKWLTDLKLNSLKRVVSKQNIPVFLLLVSFLVYTLYWSYITILRFYSLNATIFDLGMFRESPYLFFYEKTTFPAFLLNLLRWTDYYWMAGFILPLNYPYLLIIQSFFIGAASFPIFGISNHFLKSKSSSLLISLSYLVYFPLAGVNWFDIHTLAFFPFLFLLGYYLFLKGRYMLSTVIFLLSGQVEFPNIIFPFLFGLFTIIEILIQERFNKRNKLPKQFKYALFLAISSFLILVSGFYFLEGGSISNSANLIHTSSQVLPLTYDLDNKIFTIMLFLTPVALMPLFSKKWLVFTLPYFFLVLSSNTGIYTFPRFMSLTETAEIIPFIYLATIVGIYNLNKLTPEKSEKIVDLGTSIDSYKRNKEGARNKLFKNLASTNLGLEKKIVILIFVLIILFAFVYEPYGPLNKYSNADYNLQQNLVVNMTLFNELEQMINMIPKNDPYVLVQNNMPEYYPRQLPYNGSYMIAGVVNFSANLAPNHICYQTTNGNIVNARIDYILADQYSTWFYYGNPSMCDFVTKLYSGGHYGILAEASGLVLLERNYTGPIKLYDSFDAYLKASTFFDALNDKSGNNNISGYNLKDQTMWYGGQIFLMPGKYNVSFELCANNVSVLNHITLDAVYRNNSGDIQLLDALVVNGSNLIPGRITNVSILITVNKPISDVQFRGLYANWLGKLSFKGVKVAEINS